MSSNALESQGLVIQISNEASPEVYTTIAEVSEVSGPGGSAAVIDVTDLSSTSKEKRMGLPDEGQITFTINYIPSNTQHALLRTVRAARTERSFRILFTDSPQTQWDFNGFVTGFEMSNSVDDVTKANVTIEVTGSITES